MLGSGLFCYAVLCYGLVWSDLVCSGLFWSVLVCHVLLYSLLFMFYSDMAGSASALLCSGLFSVLAEPTADTVVQSINQSGVKISSCSLISPLF